MWYKLPSLLQIELALALLASNACIGQFDNPEVIVNKSDCQIHAHVVKSKLNIKLDIAKMYYWYANSTIHETQGDYTGKLLDGGYICLYSNGQLKEKGLLKEGLKVGVWKIWNENGTLLQVTSFKNGCKNGKYDLYNENGVLIASGNFKNDKLNGNLSTYETDGALKTKIKYKNGKEKAPKIKVKRNSKKKKRSIYDSLHDIFKRKQKTQKKENPELKEQKISS